MSRRIEVELTSARDDGTWTWRAAGAKQPKGVLDGGLLYAGAKVGDVVKAEADFEMEGISITSVFPPKAKDAKPAESRLQIIGPPRVEREGVTTELTGRSDRSGRDRRPPRDGDRRPPRDGDRRPPRDGERAGGPRPTGDQRGRPGADRGQRGGDRPPRPVADRGARPERSPRTDRGPRPERAPRTAPEPKPKAKKLNPANTHRAAVLETLSPEQRPIAEQFLKGGIPAVRQAVDAQNAAARSDGSPDIPAAPVMAIAEEIAPRLKAAEWLDRAEAAAASVDEISIRDLRSVVATADAARDDHARELAVSLRAALERRVAALQEQWLRDVTTALAEDRLVRALRISGRPPEPGSKLPAEVIEKLNEAAGSALSPEATPDRWAVLLDAVASSPVRRTVKPVGLPAEPGEPLLQAAKQASARVPAVAALLGVEVPPPPAKPGRGQAGSGRGAVAAGRAPGRPGIPPPPPRPPKPKPATPASEPAAAPPTEPLAVAVSADTPAPAADANVVVTEQELASTGPVGVETEEAEQIERPVEDDVPRPGLGAAVPSGQSERAPDDASAVPVVSSVADEDGLGGGDAERVENGSEPLGAPEVVGEERGGGPPTEPG